MDQVSDNLIMFENDLHFESLKDIINNYKNVYIILLKDEQRQIKLSQSVLNFKQKLISEFVDKFDNVTQIDSNSLKHIFRDLKKIDLIYPGVGENNDFINKFKIQNDKSIFNLVREEDLFAWKFAKKGFFKFKENIPKINQKILENYAK